MHNQTSKQNGSNQVNLQIAAFPVNELEGFLVQNQITIQKLVALAIKDDLVEAQWLAGDPAKLDSKLDLAVRRTPGFYHFGSIQQWLGKPAIFAEAETDAIRNQHFTAVVQTVARVVLAQAKEGKQARDLLLAAPKDAPVLDCAKVMGAAIEPIITGKNANAFANPRIAKNGLYASRDRQVVYFARNSETGEMNANADTARVIVTLPETIRYLNRVHEGKQTLVATTEKGIANAIGLGQINAEPNATAKILTRTETDAYFVGSPGGNGVPVVLELGMKGGERTIRLTPRNAAGHIQNLVAQAC
ncbi:hypothetical protein EPN90_02885 [Patescibacteria group bacterium]|nr:MAG: hypothetical protein EPN90_02885 [Patescibacteria group bacterium]